MTSRISTASPQSAKPKVFCIGFHKTGTTSLYAALSELEYRVTGTVLHHWSAEDIQARGSAECIRIMEAFDGAEDMPWPHFFRELDEAYPGSKFILSTRAEEKWYGSINNHFGHQATELNAFAYGRERARASDHKDHWIQTYRQHNDTVRDYFKDRPGDLLEIDVTNGEGWGKLCAFLGHKVPSTPFPAKNTSTARQSLAYRVKRKFWLMMGRTPHPERLV